MAFAHATTCCVDKLESAIAVVGLSNDAHVTNAIATSTAIEEHEVARFQLVAVHATAVAFLVARSAREAVAEIAKHIAGETRAVEAFRAHCAMHIRSAFERERIREELIHLCLTVMNWSVDHLVNNCAAFVF